MSKHEHDNVNVDDVKGSTPIHQVVPTRGISPSEAVKEMAERRERYPDADFSLYLALIKPLAGSGRRGNSRGEGHVYDVNRQPVAIRCCYHNKWELVGNHPEISNHADGGVGRMFGRKEANTHGLQVFCKEGMNAYDKRNRTYNRETAKLAVQFIEGTISPDEEKKRKLELLAAKQHIEPSKQDGALAFDTRQEAIDYLIEMGIDVHEDFIS